MRPTELTMYAAPEGYRQKWMPDTITVAAYLSRGGDLMEMLYAEIEAQSGIPESRIELMTFQMTCNDDGDREPVECLFYAGGSRGPFDLIGTLDRQLNGVDWVMTQTTFRVMRQDGPLIARQIQGAQELRELAETAQRIAAE